MKEDGRMKRMSKKAPILPDTIAVAYTQIKCPLCRGKSKKSSTINKNFCTFCTGKGKLVIRIPVSDLVDVVIKCISRTWDKALETLERAEKKKEG